MPMPNSKYADVPLRIRSWGIMICIFAVAISHPYTMYLFCLWISFQGMTELGRLFRYETTYWRIAVPLLQGILLIGCPAYPDYMIGAGIFVCIGLILSCSLRQIPLGLPISLLIVLVAYPHLIFLRM